MDCKIILNSDRLTMKKLLLLLGLIAIAYPLEVSARDLVRLGERQSGAVDYIWQDSINKKGNFVWWRAEKVRHGKDGRLEEHLIADFSGDCKNMSSRVQKLYDQVTGESFLKPGELSFDPPESVGFTMLKYACSSK